ncbi:MAG: UbiA family prenyltransferase [bacterium]
MRAWDLVFAARPMLWLPILSVYLITVHFQSHSDSLGFSDAIKLIAMILIAAGAYYLNQVHDYESDLTNRKMGFLQNGWLTERNLMVAYLVCSLAGLLLSSAGSTWNRLILLLLFVLGWLYSAPPAKLKDRPLAGLLVDTIVYGLLVPLMAASSLHYASWLLAVYFALTVAATHMLTTMLDQAGDESTGKRTVALVLPATLVKLLSLGCLLASVAVAWQAAAAELVYLSILAATLVAAATVFKSHALLLLATKVPLLGLTLLAGFYYGWYLAFVVALILATRLYYARRFGQVYPKLA